MKSRIRSLIVAPIALFLIAGGFQYRASDEPWRKALPPYDFSFNRDHASHPDYQVEWWYYTGNLKTSDGRRFGYQLTFFRVGVDFKPSNPSRWAVRDLFMTHLAVSDIDGRKFRHSERINRAGIGWAGAQTDTYRVWNENWEARQDPSGRHVLHAVGQAVGQAVDGEEIGLELELDEGKRPVFHGRQGVSQKGNEPGNASHYYSLTRMPTRGTLIAGGERLNVEGLSWMDHEFGTSFLEKGQMGWDWFSIQLEDGTDLMLYRFRRDDSSPDCHSSGTLVFPDGSSSPVGFDQFDLAGQRVWNSDLSGAKYPVEWRVRVPGREIDLIIRAAIDDQEMRTAQSTGVNYWEGSIEASGTHRGIPVKGRGYLEMTGYAGAAMGVLSQ